VEERRGEMRRIWREREEREEGGWGGQEGREGGREE